MSLYFKLLTKPVFSIEDVNKYYDNLNSARSAVRRLVNSGMVKKIRNNMYTCTNGEGGMSVANRFQIGSSINTGAYISHHTAMEYYGITDQVFYEVYVTSNTKFNDFEFDGYRYHHIFPSISGGITNEEYSGGIRVTDKERTILDSIKDLDKIAGIEEVAYNINAMGRLNEDKLLLYLEQYNNQFLYQKTGFFLSKDENKHGLSEGFFEKCHSKIAKSKRYLTKDAHSGTYDAVWQVIVPDYIDNMKNGDFLDADI